MTNYKYDLHIHSCLSPCADDDMTPGNIAGMAAINGLGIVALTDHNSCKNCPAFFAHAKRHGIVPIAGMEITTSEDIHMICLFEGLEDAMRFDAVVYEKLIKVKNKPKNPPLTQTGGNMNPWTFVGFGTGIVIVGIIVYFRRRKRHVK